jgi:hypothetical protein
MATGLTVPPRTWSAWFRQFLAGLALAVVLIAVLALVSNNVPWALLLALLGAVLVASVLGTAYRIRRDRT